ncbi:FAD-binding oxidoreductase [Candidatus Thorarchaeota archaeon]|nr:MAG: FAD-binding oxidoreductase [Candidatus Thorarchaeota archaeon]
MKLRDVVMGANASIYRKLDFSKIKGVYYPKTEMEAQKAIKFASSKGLDIIPKGGGSSLSGACTGGNLERFFISSLQMKKILTISMDEGYADIQAGVTPNEINDKLQSLGMKFWVAPSSRDVATVGGIVGTDGGGNDTWVNGTMRDNMLRVKILTYDGKLLTIDRKGVKSDDPDLEEELNKIQFTLDDVAGSHGTLGFITEVRVMIRPNIKEKTVGAIIEFDDYDTMGTAIAQMIRQECPIQYGEAIVMAHDEVREGLNLPILILEFPKDFEMTVCYENVKEISRSELDKLEKMRIELPKRNPKSGIQFALFEDYGIHGKSLEYMENTIGEIDSLLTEYGLTPFAKYGHAPSKWYLGDNTPAYGLIMHSREIKPENKSGQDIYKSVKAIVKLCDELGVTPKPEHKWPYSDEIKKARLSKIREVLDGGFNSFIFESDCATGTLSSMV